MTFIQLKTEVWNALGQPTDWTTASALLNTVVNQAQVQVATWKDPATNHGARFRELISEMFFQSSYTTGTLTGDSASTTIVLPSGTGANNDQYNGWVVSVGGETKVIMDYVGATLTGTVHEAWGTTPETGDTYELYKRFFYLLPSTHDWASEHITLPSSSSRSIPEGNLLEPLKIEDLPASRTLSRAVRNESWPTFTNSSGDPTSWLMDGKRIVFDVNVNSAKWFRMEYYRLPQDMSSDSDEPELPEQFHYAIVLWAVWWGYRKTQEHSAAYAAKRDFQDAMRSAVSSYEVQSERENSGLRMKAW